MPRVGFESTISVFERAKTIHALDPAATVIGLPSSSIYNLECYMIFYRKESIWMCPEIRV
jgi:hypothetical protein